MIHYYSPVHHDLPLILRREKDHNSAGGGVRRQGFLDPQFAAPRLVP